jgi:hypothetical protein
MDEKQQRQVNEAAKKFAESLTEAYRAVAGRSVSTQELNAQLTQDFFNGVINNLRTQAESNRALAEDLIEQQRKQQEASQTFTQESVNAYMDFLNSMFAYSRQGTEETAERTTREARGVPPRGMPEDVRRGTSRDTPITPPEEAVPPDVSSPPGEEQAPREAPPPGEERPERRGAAPTTPPTPREEPPAGEERPGRRTP